MRSRPDTRLFVFILTFVLFTAGCTTFYNPATGRTEAVLINTGSEVSLGRNMDAEVTRQTQLSSDPVLQNRLNTIGCRLVKVSDRKDLTYQFKVVRSKDSKDVNAFSIPGGYIYIYDELMRQTTDDELAGVVAHEMGHIVARHAVKQLQTSLGYEVLMSIALGPSSSALLTQATNVVFNLVNLGYSRGDEYQADDIAVRYTCEAGFNPDGLITFFQKLQKQAQGGVQIPFLSTHPAYKDRIQRVRDEIKSQCHGQKQTP
ncbi:MAG: M48 family metallopeptidase [Deltaproteobacteria bacterium]